MNRFAVKYLRTYQPHASMDGLPSTWVTALAADYQAVGFRVETGADWLRVHGLAQAALSSHVNDPLGLPGQQDPRNPQTTIKRHRPRLDVPPARGRKRYRKPGSQVRFQKLLGRPRLPLPGSRAADLRGQRLRVEEADAMAAEERRHLRPDFD
jgi:hypothetical protein